jgi:hypothetical protein
MSPSERGRRGDEAQSVLRAVGPLCLLLAVAMAILASITKMPGETTIRLLVGWFAFVSRSYSKLTVNWNGVATAAVCMALLVLGGHWFLTWLVTPMRPANTASARDLNVGSAVGIPSWSMKRTIQLLMVFMLLFVAGTAFIGLMHQTVWLATAPEPLTRFRLDLGPYADVSNHLKQMGLACQNFADVYPQSVPNGAAPNLKQASHSWQTRILPYLSVQGADIDFTRDWDDPKNAPAFRRFVRQYLNADIGELRESRGYAVSHYAGNSRLFSRPQPPREVLGQGASNTVLCGQVAGNFMAWGDPANLRDPMAGVNRTPGGFGSTDERGAYFLMADGSVRFLSTDTDQQALAALAIPMPSASDHAR